MTFEEQLRRHLADLADQGGSTERLRAEVRARLEAHDDGIAFLEPATRRPRPRTPWNAAAVSAALLIGAVVAVAWLAGDAGQDAVTERVPPPTSMVGERVASSTDPGFTVVVPTDTELSVRRTGDGARTLGFDVTGGSLSGTGQIVFAVPAADDETVDPRTAVVDVLLANLAQVEAIDVADSTFAGAESTRVRLRSVRAMTLVGFRLGQQTFVSASGVDRVYELHLLDRPDGGALAVWTDAPTGEIDSVRALAESMARSLQWRG